MVRTRFAPSPTGDLHVGSARTALFSWLYAKHAGGKFILRVEDTDLERSTQEACDVILDGMAWLGLHHDEGPFHQTHNFARYREVIEQLILQGDAYRCYCSKARLETLRETQLANKDKPRYDRLCRQLTEKKDEPFVIRFKTPLEGSVTFKDSVRGDVTVQNAELDDLVIARTDGVPTYNLSVVVDDSDMKITHVIRGDDHINNTPRQINILKALGAEQPIYAHVPMVLGSDGKRLSKRHGAVSVLAYREAGYLPHALLNYLIRLGWSSGDQEIFSIQEMQKLFNLDHLSHSPAAFDFDKLDWLNQHYLKTMPPEDVAPHFLPFLADFDVEHGPDIVGVIVAQRERCKTLKEMAERSAYFYSDNMVFDEKAVAKHLKPESAPVLDAIVAGLEALPDWTSEGVMEIMHAVGEALDLKLGKVAAPIRVAVTGGAVSPPLGETLSLLGRERSLARLKDCLLTIK